MFVRRLILAFSIVLCGSLALAAAALAAGSGFGPGKSTFSSTGANASFGVPKGAQGPFVTVSVNQGYNSFKPMHPAGPRTVVYSTMVQYSEFDPTTGVGGFGCFVVPAGDFTVSKDLQGATLNATLTADEQCPGFGTPVGQVTNPTAFAGGGGGGGLNLPITVNLSWSGSGAVSTFQDRSGFSCLGFDQDTTSKYLDSLAVAQGTISSQTGRLSSDYADVNSSAGTMVISGSPSPLCFGF
ncbi:MAG TPA: hypothetical protein VJT78_11890 [Candidatus Dormibacteraeota bacterium]|nr:hypothetical protein [Candidatus Dormibacteraeota bacterium]